MRKIKCGTMTEEECLESFRELLDRLSELAEDHVIVVEGKKDREALEALGIRGDIYLVQSSGGPTAAAEYVEAHGGKAVVLTDWDRTGDILSARISGILGERPGVDTRIRLGLAGLCKMYVKDVEALDSLYDFLTGKVYER